VQDPATGTVHIDHKKVSGNGYPGTMVAYMAVPTSGLQSAAAGYYADFIEFMASEGQTPGSAITNLPPGYDPLPDSMREQARQAAKAVREQRGIVPPPVPLAPGGTSAVNGPAGGQGAASTPAPPASAEAAKNQPSAVADASRPVAATQGIDSWLSRWALVLLIAAGGLAAVAALVAQVSTQPGHPVRRALGRFTALVRRGRP
jgi:hypothetical protein